MTNAKLYQDPGEENKAKEKQRLQPWLGQICHLKTAFVAHGSTCTRGDTRGDRKGSAGPVRIQLYTASQSPGLLKLKTPRSVDGAQ